MAVGACYCQGAGHNRPSGRCKILGVLLTLMACYSCYIEILGVLNTTFFLILRSAIAPPVPPTLHKVCCGGERNCESEKIFYFALLSSHFGGISEKVWDAGHVNIYLDKKLILRLLKCNAQTLVILSSPIKQHVTLCFCVIENISKYIFRLDYSKKHFIVLKPIHP